MQLLILGIAWALYLTLVVYGYWRVAMDAFGSKWSDVVLQAAGSSGGSTLLAGFGGVVLGGLISYALAARASRETLSRDREERTATQRLSAVRALMHAYTIMVDVAATRRAVEESLEEANAKGLTGWPLSSRIKGILGPSQPPPFDPSVLAPFVDAREYQLVPRYLEMVAQHEVLLRIAQAFTDRKLEIGRLFPPSSIVDGTVLRLDLSESEAMRFAPFRIELDGLARDLKARAESTDVLARDVCLTVGQSGRRIFGTTFPSVKFDNK